MTRETSVQMSVQLDANASYGLLREVKDALFEKNPSLQYSLYNPSSVHQSGQRARACLETTREKIRALCGFKLSKSHTRERIIFTSGATEANNQALETLCGGTPLGHVLITSAVEHPSVIEKAKELIRRGGEVHFVTPDAFGCWPRENIKVLIQSAHTAGKSVGVSLMHANNEVGVIYDTVETFRELLTLYPHIVTHADAVQTFGKISIEPLASVANLITISGHKIGALSGVGALIGKSGTAPQSIIVGGPQELKFRAGTENVLGIYSLGVALEKVIATGLLHHDLASKRAFFINALNEAVPNVAVNGAEAKTPLLSTVNIYIPGLRGEDAVVGLDLLGVLVSYGSACSSGKQDVSHVLKAMSITEERAKSSIRCSFRHDITEDEIQYAVRCIAQVSESVRAHGIS